MKRINKFKNFNRIFEALNPLEQAYLDEIKRRVGSETEEKMRTGELLPPIQFFENLKKIERIHSNEANRQRLEVLAKDVIMNDFGDILGGVVLNMKILDKNSDEFKDMHQKMVLDEDESEERIDETDETDEEDENPGVEIPPIEIPEADLTDEIDKRKLINIFIQGSAKNLHRLLHTEMSKSGLDEIDPELFDLLDKTIKTNELIEWQIPEEDGAGMIQDLTNGMNEVSWGDEEEKGDEEAEGFLDDCENGECNSEEIPDMDLSGGVPTINAIAIDYIILLHEAVKGIYELIAQNGIPEDYEKSKRVLAKTDTLADEFHDLKYGTYIRRDIVDFINQNPKINQIDNHIEFIFYKIVEYPAENFVDFIWGMIKGTDEARFIVDGMIDIVYDEEQEHKRQMRVHAPDQALNNDAPNIPNTNDRPEMGTSTVDDILGTTSPDVVDNNPAQSQSLDYSQMSQRDLKDEMDAALDDGDYDTAKKIQPFLENKKSKLSRFDSFKRK